MPCIPLARFVNREPLEPSHVQGREMRRAADRPAGVELVDRYQMIYREACTQSANNEADVDEEIGQVSAVEAPEVLGTGPVTFLDHPSPLHRERSASPRVRR